MTAEAAIVAQDLGKRFRIYASPWGRLIPGCARPAVEIWSLRNVSFTVNKGRCLGIIGRNGAGKSTLLKILTGVTDPTEGRVILRGKVLALLELGTGFNGELTGRENVFVSGVLLNTPPDVLQSRIKEIEEFAEIGEYFDKPMKTYSSGMSVRLGFSIYANLEPEILIIDEALSVGDLFFQQKCAAKIREIKQRGTTIVFVSHDMSAVQELCDEVILLDKGECLARGKASFVAARYSMLSGANELGALLAERTNEEASMVRSPASDRGDRIIAHDIIAGTPSSGNDGLRILGLRVTTDSGRDALSFQTGDRMVIEAVVEARRAVPFANFGISIADAYNRALWSSGTTQHGITIGALSAGERFLARVDIDLAMPPGIYRISVAAGDAAYHDPTYAVWHDMRVDAFKVEIKPSTAYADRHGLIYTPMTPRAP